MQILQWLMANLFPLLGAISAALAALIVVFQIIPGEQPEKALQAVVDFIEKFSKK